MNFPAILLILLGIVLAVMGFTGSYKNTYQFLTGKPWPTGTGGSAGGPFAQIQPGTGIQQTTPGPKPPTQQGQQQQQQHQYTMEIQNHVG